MRPTDKVLAVGGAGLHFMQEQDYMQSLDSSGVGDYLRAGGAGRQGRWARLQGPGLSPTRAETLAMAFAIAAPGPCHVATDSKNVHKRMDMILKKTAREG